MNDAKVRVDVVMGEIERDVRARLRRHLLKQGGADDYQDEEIFDAVHALLARAVDGRNLDAMLLPELVDGDVDWRLQTHLTLTTHRPAVGRFILFAKQKLLLPLTRWLFEYSQENFRRQDHLNRILFACIEELALENAHLRRQIGPASVGKPESPDSRSASVDRPESPDSRSAAMSTPAAAKPLG